MEYIIKLSEEDYLTYNLFTASHSSVVKTSRQKNRIFLVATFLLLGFVFYRTEHTFLMYYFIFFAVVVLFLYPKYSKWAYKRNFKKHLRTKYRENFNQEVNISFHDTYVLISSNAGETRLNISEFVVIDEIQTHYFLTSSNGQSLIVPKAALNLAAFEKGLQELTGKHGIRHVRDLNWAWK